MSAKLFLWLLTMHVMIKVSSILDLLQSLSIWIYAPYDVITFLLFSWYLYESHYCVTDNLKVLLISSTVAVVFSSWQYLKRQESKLLRSENIACQKRMAVQHNTSKFPWHQFQYASLTRETIITLVLFWRQLSRLKCCAVARREFPSDRPTTSTSSSTSIDSRGALRLECSCKTSTERSDWQTWPPCSWAKH